MKIAVLFGGYSTERDVSIASGIQVADALRQSGHEVMLVDTAGGILTPDREKSLNKGIGITPPDEKQIAALQAGSDIVFENPEWQDIDVAFIALHGGAGEDGTIQASLDAAGITYTGSGHLACANAMNKDISKQLFRSAGIPTADWCLAPVSQEDITKKLVYPVVVKPNSQGSSVGLTVVKTPDELLPGIELAYNYDNTVMIEQFIEGRELTVGILGDEPLSVGEIIPKRSSFFDYESKYQQDGAEEIFPAEVPAQLGQDAKRLALHAHQILKLEGFSRIDFRLDQQGQLWCLEANTVPGLTAVSLLPKSARAAGINFPELCNRICELALTRKQ